MSWNGHWANSNWQPKSWAYPRGGGGWWGTHDYTWGEEKPARKNRPSKKEREARRLQKEDEAEPQRQTCPKLQRLQNSLDNIDKS